jgi:hypothetical protein
MSEPFFSSAAAEVSLAKRYKTIAATLLADNGPQRQSHTHELIDILATIDLIVWMQVHFLGYPHS